jgi:hypothetical protein
MHRRASVGLADESATVLPILLNGPKRPVSKPLGVTNL